MPVPRSPRPNRSGRRRLRLENLEDRRLLAATDEVPGIVGTVYRDADGNGQPGPTEVIAGATVQLFADDGDGIFEPDGDDTQVGPDALTDSNGVYLFENLDTDTAFFVRQPAQTVGTEVLDQAISELLEPSVPDLWIDDFDGPQEAHATGAEPSAASSQAFPSATRLLGQERDLSIALQSGMAMNLLVDQTGAEGVLALDATSGASGTYTITWDGIDGDGASLAHHLGSVDLTQDDTLSGILLRAGVDSNGGTVRVRYYSGDSATVSEATAELPQTSGGLPTAFVFIPFSDFTGSADATAVSAVQVMIEAAEPTDGQVDLAGVLGPKVHDFDNASEVTGQADLAVAKTNNRLTSVPGQSVTYNVVVTNNGPDPVSGAVLTDTFPAQLLNVTYTSQATGGAEGNTADGTGNISDTLDLPVGGTVTYTISGQIASSATGQLTNTATVTAPEGVSDTNLTNNSSSDTDTLNPTVDLLITKTDGRTAVAPGSTVTYTIEVQNLGPSDVDQVQVLDEFPDQLSDVTFTGQILAGSVSGNSASGSGDLNELVNLSAGGRLQYTVTATVSPSATGSITNTAIVQPPGGITEFVIDNNVATDTDTISNTLDLSVTKSDGTLNAVPGESLTYTIVVANSGPMDAQGVQLEDVFPAVLQNVSFTSQAAGGATGSTAEGTGELNETLDMPAGSSVTYTVTATVSPTATGTLVNTVTVTAPDNLEDSDPSNNTATDSDTLLPEADLSVTKSDSQEQVAPGQSLTYTVVLQNLGPSDVTGATVSDLFPEGLTGVTFTSTATGGATGNTASGSGDLAETVNLPAGSSITYLVTGLVASSATGSLTNTATVTVPGAVADPNMENNTAIDTNTISNSVDLQITKTNNVDSLVPGQQVTYQVVVSNAGPIDVVGASVLDTIGTSLTSVTFTSSATGGATGNTASGSGSIDDTVSLPAGSSITYTLVGTVAATAEGTLDNTASVDVPEGLIDTNTANNQATDSDPLVVQADLSITKTDGVTEVSPGGTVTYTITVGNSGPSAVAGVGVSDVLPEALINATFTSVASGGATGNTESGSGDLAETLTLPPGSQVVYTIVATVDPVVVSGTVVNTAAVTAREGVEDPDLDNNSQTDTNQVVLPTGSISGRVFFDRDGDVVLGRDDSPIWGVRIRLTGTDILGQNVDRMVQTDVFGRYEFTEVMPGEYLVAEEQPVLFADGGERAGADGSLGTNPANDVLALTLAPGQQAEGFDFAEGTLQLSKRDFLAGPPPSGE